MLYTLLVTLSILASSAFAGQTLACGNAKIPLRIDPRTDQAVSQETCLTVNNGDAPFYRYHDGDVSAREEKTKVAPPDSTCEHIMEVQMLKQVLESKGGPCDHLEAETDAAKRLVIRGHFKEIVKILNSSPNLVFAENTLETQKGAMVTKAQSGKPFQKKKDDPNLRNRLEAVDTFVNKQTKAHSTGVAHALDAKIAEFFPGTTDKVTDRWEQVLAYASTCYHATDPYYGLRSSTQREHMIQNSSRRFSLKAVCIFHVPRDSGQPPSWRRLAISRIFVDLRAEAMDWISSV